MASFAEQIAQAKIGARAAAALEATNRSRIERVFDAWESGTISNRQVRHRMENVLRAAWRASGATARATAQRAADLDGWTPANQTFSTPYLNDLRADVRRNLREYSAARARSRITPEELEKARRRAILRMSHSAGVATTRGYTDALIAAYSELEDFGYRLVKMWMANFDGDHMPCPHCRKLHGARAGLHESFRAVLPDTRRLAVYRDLQGPPRHPQCQCWLAILVITLENAFEKIEPEAPPVKPPSSSSAESVRNLPLAIFMAIIAAIRAAVRLAQRK